MEEEKRPLLTITSESAKTSLFSHASYGSQQEEEEANSDQITYTWCDLNIFANEERTPERSFFGTFSKSVECRKHILKNVKGVAYPGELLAILGSSGAGKTTLLNALTFHTPSNMVVTGFRCANGASLTYTSLTSRSAYVQQDDLFFSNLTVREHLIFHALVRMDKKIPYKERMKRVDEVISELCLKKCENTRIGIPGAGISGGERKRLAFASEVLTNPSLMFCDEPTSGLDSYMALNVVQVLKNLAKSGKTVVCTIHQPSSELYSLFDKVLYMAEGRIAFLGTPDEADLFFNELKSPCPHNYNPADYYVQLLAIAPGAEESSRQGIDMICNNFESSAYGNKIPNAISTMGSTEVIFTDFWTGSESKSCPYKASYWAQLKAVMWRSWICAMKEPMLIKVRFLQTVMVSIVIGVLYFQQKLTQEGVMNINGAMFIFLTSMTFQNVFAVVNVFCSDFPIFLREHLNGMYRTDVYFLCRTLAELPIFIMIPIIYMSICYYMIGLNEDIYRFLISVGLVVLVANVATSFGYLISCASSSVSMAMSIGPPLIIPFLLFGGFFLNINSIPLYFKWLSYFSWFRYGNEAMMINQWSNVDSIDCDDAPSTCPRNGRAVLEVYAFNESNFYVDVVMLVGLFFIFRFTAYLALLCRTLKMQ